MNINPTGAAVGPQALAKLTAARTAYGAAPAQPARSTAADRLELSGVSHLLQLAKSNDVRMEKVQTIMAEIEADTYDLDAKADTVADRLLDDLAEE